MSGVNELRAQTADRLLLAWVLRWISGEGVNVAREASRHAYFAARGAGASKDEARQTQLLVAARAEQLMGPARGGTS